MNQPVQHTVFLSHRDACTQLAVKDLLVKMHCMSTSHIFLTHCRCSTKDIPDMSKYIAIIVVYW